MTITDDSESSSVAASASRVLLYIVYVVRGPAGGCGDNDRWHRVCYRASRCKCPQTFAA
jgi:hypothetical protein